LAVAALGPLGPAPRAAHAANEYQVNTLIDNHDSSLGDSICSDGIGGCPLRAAIEEASADGVPTTITFKASILNGIPQVLDGALGTILWTGSNITVTGESLSIIVSGELLTDTKSIIRITGDNNVVKSIILRDAPGNGIEVGQFGIFGTGNDNLLQSLVVTGSGRAGVYVTGGFGGGGQRNQIFSNAIGLSNFSALGCAGGEGNQVGILVGSAAGDTVLTGNLVGCSAQDGISIDGSSGAPLNTLLFANRVGVNLAPVAVPNGWAGVSIVYGAQGTTLDQNTLSGNTQQGLYVTGAATSQITVTSNNIGLNQLGTFSVPNQEQGVLVAGLPGAAMTVRYNIVSGNGLTGILIDSSAYVTLTNNLVGTSASGTVAWPNGGDGIKLRNGANHILIGGSDFATKNSISGNTGNGVVLDGPLTTLNVVTGNNIGNYDGISALPNGANGVLLTNSAYSNTIGSRPTGFGRNIISGNALDGVSLTNLATHNTVNGNFIGVTGDGFTALPNGLGGVSIIGADGNFIGSPSATVTQLISGNTLQGIFVQNADDNYIGPTTNIGVADDLSSPVGNGAQGIWLDSASNNTVAAGVVGHNGGAGVSVTGNTAAANVISFILNFDNGGLPIDLNDDGPTANDPGDTDSGPNDLQNYPVITAVAGNTVTGTACANCLVNVYRAIGSTAAPRGGGQFVGTTVADGGGNWSVNTLPSGLTRFDVSATACSGACLLTSGTSEMSPVWRVLLPLVLR
jgi:parallel beta-helix repeat protein